MTRDRKEPSAEWNGRTFTLVDTGGVDLEDRDELAESICDQARAAMADAAWSSRRCPAGAPQGQDLADMLRRSVFPDPGGGEQVRWPA